MRQSSDRRSFVASVASLVGLAAVGEGLDPAMLDAAEPAATPSGPWDLSWLNELRGKHKQVFSIGDLKGHQPLHVVVNWLDAHQEVFGLSHPKVNAVVGIATSFPINASDALWAKYELGRLWELNDPDTGTWARRNVYLDAMPARPGKVVGVRPLQARGAIFWQCNNALDVVARRLAREFGGSVEAIRAELLAGLNPGVKLVPAHTMLLGLAQEHGCTYEQIG
jgi:hypothetical protein